MSNRLAEESSPYLLQHQHNPVDWYPWGPEALDRAQTEQKPIFLSIGYSACHWCHVMEHESFEDPRIAQLMNEHFVNIKVDREERPDLDQIYMTAVQALAGRGGWPMSVFLTPDGEPFYGGTYWPPTSRMGMPGFDQVLQAVTEAWHNRRDQTRQLAAELTADLTRWHALAPATTSLDENSLVAAANQLERSFDSRHGGFGEAPKFPHPMDLRLLMRVWRRTGRSGLADMVWFTLDKMAAGGIYDHLGGGFHRYSVDERWLVPHFEKMLYDNALLVAAYAEAYQATGKADYARIVRETCDYVLRDMTDVAGGFYSTEDADSEGQEGKFYVWSSAEIESLLGPDRAATFSYVYDVSDAGNFEKHNILNLPKTLAQVAAVRHLDPLQLERQLALDRERLLAARERRVRPGRDDKVLVAWNGLMIEALSLAGSALAEPRYIEAARRAADFLLAQLRMPNGRVWHTWRGGQAKVPAFLDDYAALANGLLALYQCSFDERYFTAAQSLLDTVLARFADPAGPGFFYTADDHERLVSRQKDFQDGATPSGNALTATALVTLAKLTGQENYRAAAEQTMLAAGSLMQRAPTAAGQMLLAVDLLLGPTLELVFLADPTAADTSAILADLGRRFLPHKVVALRAPAEASPPAAGGAKQDESLLAPLFAGKENASSHAALYVCEQFACQSPAIGAEAIRAKLDELQGLGPGPA